MTLDYSRDPFAPNYFIEINGESIPTEISKFISSVEYEDNSEMMDKITMNIATLQSIQGDQIMSLLDSKLFTEGNLIELYMGYGSSMVSVGAAEIIRLIPLFPKNGIPSLSVIAYDISHRMTDRKSEKGIAYKNFRDSQVSSIIGDRNGVYIRKADPTTFSYIYKTKGIHNRVQKKGVNDYEFLRELADFNGYDFYVRYAKVKGSKRWVMFFHPSPDKQKPIYKYRYNLGEESLDNTLLDFTPDMSIKDQDVEYEIISFDKSTGMNIKTLKKDGGKEFRFNAAEDKYEFKKFEDRKFLGKDKTKQIKKQIDKPGAIKFKAFGKTREIVISELRSEADAKRYIEVWIKQRKDNFVTGSGSVIGTETLQSRQVHELEGIGTSLSGNYYFTKVIHKFTTGNESPYICDFTCRRVVE